MRFLSIIPAMLAALMLCSCAEPVIFSEVFQQKLDQKIYTKYIQSTIFGTPNLMRSAV